MKRALARLFGGALAIAALWLAGVASWIAAGPREQPGAKADYAVVLGAAVVGSEPSPVFAARIDQAIELYRSGQVRRVLFTGGRSAEDALSEAEAAAAYARRGGVPAEAIVLEGTSRTTRENLERAARVLGVLGEGRSARLLIVTDPLHMRRAMAIANDAGLNASPSSAAGTRYRTWRTKAPFLAREVWFMHVHWLAGR